jgi:hypothetical protein
MTQEERTYIDASDFQEIELQCRACSARVAWDLRSTPVPDNCPLCGVEWFKRGASDDSRKVSLLDLIDALRKLKDNFKEVGCSVVFRLAEKS